MDRYPLGTKTSLENHNQHLPVAGDRAGPVHIQAPLMPIEPHQPLAHAAPPQMSRSLIMSIVDSHPTNAGRFRVLFNQAAFVAPQVLAEEFLQRVLRIDKDQFLKGDPDPFEEAIAAALEVAQPSFWESFKPGTTELRSLVARMRNWMAAAAKEKQLRRMLPGLQVLSLLTIPAELAAQTKLIPVLKFVLKNKGPDVGPVEELAKSLLDKLEAAPAPPPPKQVVETPEQPQALPPISSGSRQLDAPPPILAPPPQTAAPVASTRKAGPNRSSRKEESSTQAAKPPPSRALPKLFGGDDSIFKLSSHKRVRSASPEAQENNEPTPKDNDEGESTTQEDSELPIDLPRKKRREGQPEKTVRWKPDDELVSVRFYEVDGDGFKYRSAQSARELEHAEASATKTELTEQWSAPLDLDFTRIDVPRQLQDVMGIKRGGYLRPSSNEAAAQIVREAGRPVVIDDPDNLPVSPYEPLPVDSQPDPNAPPPLEGIALRAPKPEPAVYPLSSTPMVPVAAQNMQLTPEQQQMWAQMSMMMPMSMPTMPMNTYYGYENPK